MPTRSATSEPESSVSRAKTSTIFNRVGSDKAANSFARFSVVILAMRKDYAQFWVESNIIMTKELNNHLNIARCSDTVNPFLESSRTLKSSLPSLQSPAAISSVERMPLDQETEGAETMAIDPGRWRALWVALAAAFLPVFSFFVINIAVPSLQADLHASHNQVQLLIAGYGLTYAVFLITGGRLGDLFGRKRLYLA